MDHGAFDAAEPIPLEPLQLAPLVARQHDTRPGHVARTRIVDPLRLCVALHTKIVPRPTDSARQSASYAKGGILARAPVAGGEWCHACP